MIKIIRHSNGSGAPPASTAPGDDDRAPSIRRQAKRMYYDRYVVPLQDAILASAEEDDGTEFRFDETLPRDLWIRLLANAAAEDPDEEASYIVSGDLVEAEWVAFEMWPVGDLGWDEEWGHPIGISTDKTFFAPAAESGIFCYWPEVWGQWLDSLGVPSDALLDELQRIWPTQSVLTP